MRRNVAGYAEDNSILDTVSQDCGKQSWKASADFAFSD